MKNDSKKWCKRALLVGAIAGFTAASAPDSLVWANSGNANPGVIPPQANPFGKSYGEWSAQWWKWLLRMPATNHPAFSIDGADCGTGQSGKVWFLTGAFTTEFPDKEFNTIIRESCTVPTGKALFFPIINTECSSMEPDPYHGETPEELRACVEKFDSSDGDSVVRDLTVTIDGKPLANLGAYRFQSPMFEFSFADPADNILGVDCGMINCSNPKSLSDGYWIMLSPLSKGRHVIQFTGSYRDPATNELFFGMNVTYELTVTGGKE